MKSTEENLVKEINIEERVSWIKGGMMNNWKIPPRNKDWKIKIVAINKPVQSID